MSDLEKSLRDSLRLSDELTHLTMENLTLENEISETRRQLKKAERPAVKVTM